MTNDDIREVVLDILADIAPDEDLSQLQDDVAFRDQLELDSMDFLDIVMELRHLPPPVVCNIVLQRNTERAVVPD